MNLDELAKASCAIYVDGHRDGTGTLVTDSHVLTAAHVLRRRGPVCDKLSGLMAGVLVEGAGPGHFDRMVTLPAVRTAWDGLPRPWLFAGENARAHFTQRSAGQRSTARGGDLFRGRREALAVVH